MGCFRCLLAPSITGIFKELNSRLSPFAAENPSMWEMTTATALHFLSTVSSQVESSELPVMELSGISAGFEFSPGLLQIIDTILVSFRQSRSWC